MAFMPSLVTECAVVISGAVEVVIEVSSPLPATRKVVVAISKGRFILIENKIQ